MSDRVVSATPAAGGRVFNVGAISFLNTRPLIAGLHGNPRVRLVYNVPSSFAALLDGGQVDVALVPAIDYQRAEGRWVIVPPGCIASDGETLTVRIFSRVPIERISSLAVDTDSHTSVALARIILGRVFGIRPQLLPTRTGDWAGLPADRQPDSVLLIGDKVIAARPKDPASPWPHQLDLGFAWRHWTGLPFVFAVWAARADRPLDDLPRLLDASRRCGLGERGRIARADGPALGWPADLAELYLTRHLQYDLTDACRAGLERFYELCAAEGLIRSLVPVRTVEQD